MLDSLDRLKNLHERIEETGSDVVEIEEFPAPSKEKKTKPGKSISSGKTKKKLIPKQKKSTSTAEEFVDDDGSWGTVSGKYRFNPSRRERGPAGKNHRAGRC